MMIRTKKIGFCLLLAIVFSLLVMDVNNGAMASELNDSVDDIRIAGPDRYKTAVEVSKRAYPDGSKSVIIASGTNTADALAAGPLAHEERGPILLVGKSLDEATKEEIKRLDPSKVFIIGGYNTISKDLSDSLSAYKPIRLAGTDRYETSVQIARQLYRNHGYTGGLIANGGNTVDALASSAYAIRYNKPILLSAYTSLPASVRGYLYDEGEKSVDIVGGENSISPSVVSELGARYRNRIYGENRYDTAVQLASFTYTDNYLPKGSVIVSGRNEKLVDALAAAPFAYIKQMPILLTDGNSLDKYTKDYIEEENISDFYIIGGENTVSESLLDSLLEKSPDKDQKEEEGKENGSNKDISKEDAPKAGKLTYENFLKIDGTMTRDQVISILGKDRLVQGEDYDVWLSNNNIEKLRIVYNDRGLVESKVQERFENTETDLTRLDIDKLPEVVTKYIDDEDISHVEIVGGPAAISDTIQKSLYNKFKLRISGDNRYLTAVEVANKTYQNPDKAVLVNGNAGLVDALSAAPYAYKLEAPILLTGPEELNPNTEKYVDDNNIFMVSIIGGQNSVSSLVELKVKDLINLEN